MRGTDPTAFLREFVFEKGLLQLCLGHASQAHYFAKVPRISGEGQNEGDIYFSPAMRARKGSEKGDVLGTVMLWTEIDDTDEIPATTFPIRAAVHSGHGFHLYWKLKVPLYDLEMIEAYNQLLMADTPNVTADHCWNANRLLRVPGTMNPGKNGEAPVLAKLVHHNPAVEYDAQDFRVLATLPVYARTIIQSGASTDYDSRSERDMAVISALVKSGASDRLIKMLYEHQPVGDKYKEHGKPDYYLQRTINKARTTTGIQDMVFGNSDDDKAKRNGEVVPAGPIGPTLDNGADPTDANALVKKPTKPRRSAEITPIVERKDGYYKIGALQQRLSTFTLDPLVLLEGLDGPDAIITNVHANGQAWRDVTFPRAAFASVANMDKQCLKAEWQWLGSDNDVRALLPFLLDKLKQKGMPRRTATSMLGLHILNDEPMYLGDKQVVTTAGVYDGSEGPLAWIPTGREHAALQLCTSVDSAVYWRDVVGQQLPTLNEPEIMWPLIGWFSAAMAKPWLEQQGARFPVLNITGTKESGKTTIIKLLMQLFGQRRPQNYDSLSTPFVRLTLLGGSNAVPVYFNEFRMSMDTHRKAEMLLHDLRMAYDTGNSPRGKGDQTTVSYPLTTPVVLDGEDAIEDPAVRDRMVALRLDPNAIREGTPAYLAYTNFRALLHEPPEFAGAYIHWLLTAIKGGTAKQLLDDARAEMFKAFPTKLGDRMRNNYIVTLWGMKLFCAFTNIAVPATDVLAQSMREIADLASGRTRTAVDDFVEAIVNGVRTFGVQFAWHYDDAAKVLYFQLGTAHDWWMYRRRSSGRSAFERNSIRAQLVEAPYYVGKATHRETFMYGVSLERAFDHGLDIPQGLAAKSVTFTD